MDFLHQVGAVLDFTDGTCCFTRLGVTVNLPINSKGHFLINIADFLTDGHTCHKHSVHVQLQLNEKEDVSDEFEVKTCELELCIMEGLVSDLKSFQNHEHKKHFLHMVNRRVGLNQQIRSVCHLQMRRLRHLRTHASLVHARASATSLVHAHTFLAVL